MGQDIQCNSQQQKALGFDSIVRRKCQKKSQNQLYIARWGKLSILISPTETWWSWE